MVEYITYNNLLEYNTAALVAAQVFQMCDKMDASSPV